MSLPERSITVLVAALGGEGGGVMADWLMRAATSCDFPAQATSIPGVAQRTGATTYYLEIYPVERAALGGREPVMALTPSPGNVDVMIASELLEAARAMQNGFVSPDRTALIASTHRIYATSEKMQMADGRFDGARAIAAAERLAKRAVLGDLRALAEKSGTVINAVLFGALCGSGALPLPREVCEQAIRAGGKGTAASLRGFAAGFEFARTRSTHSGAAPQLPREVQKTVDLGVARLTDYQGAAYADRYRERVRSIATDDARLLDEVARQLAVWMSYEDLIRVADLKTRASRFERVRSEVRAQPGEPVIVVDYLKPGIEELASVLPASLGAWLMARARSGGWLDRWNIGMHVRTSGVTGFLLVRALAWLRFWRPKTYRYREEQRLIERWLAAIRAAAPRSSALALEIALCAGLLKGYGETHRRGLANFLGIFDALVESPPDADAAARAAAIAAARKAALADPEGKALKQSLAQRVIWLSTAA